MTRIHSLKDEGWGHRTHRSKKNRKKIPWVERFFKKVKEEKRFNKVRELSKLTKANE